jgi:putative endonuclease
MFTVYIIYSLSFDRYYVGHTGDIADRLFRHNNSGSKATKKGADWTLKYTKQFDSRSEAMKHEMEIKAKKSRKYIESLIIN